MNDYDKFIEDIIKTLSIASDIPLKKILKDISKNPELNHVYRRETKKIFIESLRINSKPVHEDIFDLWLSGEITAGRIKAPSPEWRKTMPTGFIKPGINVLRRPKP